VPKHNTQILQGHQLKPLYTIKLILNKIRGLI